jgi:hypothetical protein
METSTPNKNERLSIAKDLEFHASMILKDLAAAESLVVDQGIEEAEKSRLQWITVIREAVKGMEDLATLLVHSADQYE